MVMRDDTFNHSKKDADRVYRLALMRSLRDLRLSVERGRTMTLPNLLRLFQRRTLPEDPHTQLGLKLLRSMYLQQQPFASRRPRLPAA